MRTRIDRVLSMLLGLWLCVALAGCGGGQGSAAGNGGHAPDDHHADHHHADDHHADDHHADDHAVNEEHHDASEHAEGRVQLAPEAVAAGAIEVGRAGSAEIDVRVEAPGEVRLNAEHVVQVRPRFPGLVSRLERRLGDRVETGDLLAVVHSDESLADYEIRASIPGTVVQRAAAPGEAVNRETVLYTIADLTTVWVDLALYPQNVSKVQLGQEVIIRAGAGADLSATGRIRYVGPLLEQDTRISYARVVLPNDGQRWKPGLFVSGEIVVERATVPVAVPDAAIVRMGEGKAVFRAHGTVFELQMVRTGRTDGETVEIVKGLAAGDSVVVGNAYVLKAELGKSEASHDH